MGIELGLWITLWFVALSSRQKRMGELIKVIDTNISGKWIQFGNHEPIPFIAFALGLFFFGIFLTAILTNLYWRKEEVKKNDL